MFAVLSYLSYDSELCLASMGKALMVLVVVTSVMLELVFRQKCRKRIIINQSVV